MDSKSFDNSILCTNESCVIVEERCADAFERELGRHGGARALRPTRSRACARSSIPDGRLRIELIGKDAAALAAEAGIRVPPKTRVLVAPFELVVPEEPLAREKMFPLLGLVRVPDARRGIDAACAMLRIGGAGHSAVIHSRDPRTIMAYGAAVKVLRVAVNVGGSTGSAGIDTNLAPDDDDRHRLLRPLARWARTWSRATSINLDARRLRERSGRAVRRLRGPRAVERRARRCAGRGAAPMSGDAVDAREEIRRIVLEELRELVKR